MNYTVVPVRKFGPPPSTRSWLFIIGWMAVSVAGPIFGERGIDIEWKM